MTNRGNWDLGNKLPFAPFSLSTRRDEVRYSVVGSAAGPYL